MLTMPAFVHGLAEMSGATTSAVQIKGHYPSYTSSLDFDQYLLASSPPGFGYGLLQTTAVSQGPLSDFEYQESGFQFRSSFKQQASIADTQEFLANGSRQTQYTLVKSSQSAATSGKNGMLFEVSGQTYYEKEAVVQNTTKKASPGRVKKVSFADDFGLCLTEIKYFVETPDMPPIIKTKMMLHSAKLLALSHGYRPSLAQMTDVKPSLVPDFPMPISNYATFKEKLDKACVSLESLYATANRTLDGTVKVKNLAFSKTVFVHCTFDGWKSHTDIPCSHRLTSNLYASEIPFDCFSFTINVPSDFDASGSTEFAICFQCNGNDYWDNNSGANYRLVPESSKLDVEGSNQNDPRNADLKWTTYIDWKDRSMSWPYW